MDERSAGRASAAHGTEAAAPALAQSEETYRRIVDTAAEGICVLDASGAITFVNARMAAVLGYRPEELLGRTIDALVPPEDLVDHSARIAKRRAGEIEQYERRFRRKDGGVVCTLVSATPLLDAGGGFAGSFGMFTDITARKQAEQRVALLSFALNKVREAAFLVSGSGAFEYVNEEACRGLGYGEEELLRACVWDIDPDMPRERWTAHWRELERAGSLAFETRHRARDGRVFPVEIRASYFEFGGRAYNLALAHDVSERKRAETELRDQHSTLRGIIDSSNALVFSVDRAFRYTSFNRRHAAVMKALYGAEIRPGTCLLEAMTVPEDRESARRNVERALAGEYLVEESYSGEELRSRQYFHVSHSPIRTEDGEIIGVAVLAQDLTDRKRAEEQVRTLNLELERRVADRTAELEAANKELEAFAYSVSHDLRAPVRHVDGFLDLLRKRAAASLDEGALHYLDSAAGAARRMGRLIDDLLAFSRMGRQAMTRTRVDLGALARDVVAELEPEAAGRVVRWRIGALPVVTGDPALLRTVLVNLLANALKFTRPRTEAEIQVTSQLGTGGEHVVSVRDNGVGFDMTYAARLFDVFQRLHRAEEFEGVGIGLANVRRVVARHGGRVWAEAKPSEGATFSFSLPR
jgi:PAS domain S-box-containing protein